MSVLRITRTGRGGPYAVEGMSDVPQAVVADSAVLPSTRRRVLWGVILLAAGTLGPGLASVLACSPSGVPVTGPIAATATPASLPEGPPPPEGGLPIPDLGTDWEPPSAAAGDLASLESALSEYARVGLAIDPNIDQAGHLDAMHLGGVIGQLVPTTAVHPIRGDGVAMSSVLFEDPPLIPIEHALDDGARRTRWQTPEALEVDAAKLRGWSELGDPAVLIVGAVEVDAPAWRELATGTVGTCAPLTDRLLDGQRESLTLLEPFLDHADEVLARLYLAELAAVVPELQAELAEFEPDRDRSQFDDTTQWQRHECGVRYRAYLEPFAGCVQAGETEPPWVRDGHGEAETRHVGTGLEGPCPSAPRLYLNEAARIGTVEPSDFIPDYCPERLGRDYVEALRAPARTAADLAADQLDPRWMILAERLATLTEVYGAVEAVCTPGRRRFAAVDVDALRSTVAEFGALYRRDEAPAHDARFLANDGSFRVPGLGMVRQLARYDAGTGSAARSLTAGARELHGFVRERAQCSATPGTAPLMTLLLDTASARPRFLGFYYAEELWCGQLGPLGADAAASDL